jgi:hypothetical protein
MKIQMIRHTQEAGLVADVWLCKTSILTVSIPVDKCTYEALIEYALRDEEHVKVVEAAEVAPWDIIPDSVTVTNWQEDEERDADWQAQVSELRNG